MKNIILYLLILLTIVGCKEDTSTENNEYILENSYSVKKRKYSKKKLLIPKNVILLIGDGMGPGQIQAALLANKGNLNMITSEYLGMSRTLNAYRKTTDSGAGGTALSTGIKTYNGAIAVDTNKNKLKTISHIAKENGKSVGIVSSCEVVHATPASFLVNHNSRKDYEKIAEKILYAPFDFIYGGGLKRFSDDLLLKFKNKNINIIKTDEELGKIDSLKTILALMTEGHPKPYKERGNFLSKGVKKAIELLSQNNKGFFLMIEGSQIDWAGHNNELDYMIQETLDFDRVVGEVLDFSYENGETLVIVTADHETGGFLTTKSNTKKGYVRGNFSSKNHTETMVPVFSFGPKSDMFNGVYQNTEIFNKIKYIIESEYKTY